MLENLSHMHCIVLNANEWDLYLLNVKERKDLSSVEENMIVVNVEAM